MLSDPMIVDASVPAQDVCRALLADRDLRRDAYVVTRTAPIWRSVCFSRWWNVCWTTALPARAASTRR